jgi:hypothetical protein
MTKINTLGVGQPSKNEHYAGGLVIQYNVFPSVTAVDKARLKKVTDAYNVISRLDAKIDLQGPCNRYFRTLPKGQSFRSFWRDNRTFINYSPSLVNGFYGATHSNDKDICISAWCLDNTNYWMVAATIVHEFGHIAGAPGGASHAAEKAADKCGFKQQYNPAILGSIKQLGDYLEALS